jgi:hypothetical protein
MCKDGFKFVSSLCDMDIYAEKGEKFLNVLNTVSTVSTACTVCHTWLLGTVALVEE